MLLFKKVENLKFIQDRDALEIEEYLSRFQK